MDIVEVRFVKDSQSVQTGNEFYPSGAKAHFFASQAGALVKTGHAVLVNPPPIDEPPLPHGPETYVPEVNLNDYTVKELREMGDELGIDMPSRMRKAELIAALEK
jgi:hypothetical protein